MNVEDFLNAHPARPEDVEVVAACVKACFGCAESCIICADACLGEQQLDMLRRCIRIDLDCAAVCTATGGIVARQTMPDKALARSQLQACIVACQVCSEECTRHAKHHEHCRLCAESCRLCIEACNDLMRALS